MEQIRWLTAACALLFASSTAIAGDESAIDPPSRLLNEATAWQLGYYDELDLDLYHDLEAAFGESCRVFSSTNTVRFGNLQVRAKLIVPRSDALIGTGFLSSGAPEPVRIMLDYALVSCGHGCSVGILTDEAGSLEQYKANHAVTDTGNPKIIRSTASGFASKSRGNRFERHASMIVIEGKQAKRAIDQLSGSQTAHVFLVTAVHGAADVVFDTSPSAND